MHKKFDNNKDDLSLISLDSLRPISRAYGYGVTKYGRGNWRKNDIEWHRTLSSVLRHLAACQDDPVKIDPESGIMHIAHAASQLLIKLHFIENMTYTELLHDDEDERGSTND